MSASAPAASAPKRGALEERICAFAYGLGFDLVGLASLGPAETATRFGEWLQRGFAGEMSYLERAQRNARTHDSRLQDREARSLSRSTTGAESRVAPSRGTRRGTTTTT